MSDGIERRFADGVALDGRKLSGAAMVYGTDGTTPTGRRERFAPGAFGDIGDVILNVQHDRSRPLARTGAGLEFQDDKTALRLSAALPKTREARDAVALVKAGVLRGLSVEFRAVRERLDGAVRVIERAVLLGVALVDKPAYDASTVQARARENAASTPWWLL